MYIYIYICIYIYYINIYKNEIWNLSPMKKLSVSLEKDSIFRFHIYFSASFAFYFLVLDT